jgi:hypothetical protein
MPRVTRPARQPPISESEQQRREHQRAQALAARGRLLHDREQTRYLLGGVSNSTIRRLELARKLRPIKLTDSPNAKTFYTHENILETYYLLEQGHTPARKVGSIWVASKRVLTDFFRTPTNIPAPPTASEAEPPPPTPRARAVRARRR